MASQTKHMARSRRSSHSTIPTQMFADKAVAKKASKENKRLVDKFFNRITNK